MGIHSVKVIESLSDALVEIIEIHPSASADLQHFYSNSNFLKWLIINEIGLCLIMNYS